MAKQVATRLNITDFSACLRKYSVYDESGDNLSVKVSFGVMRADYRNTITGEQCLDVFYESAPFINYALKAFGITAATANKRLNAANVYHCDGWTVARMKWCHYISAQDLRRFLLAISCRSDGTGYKNKADVLNELLGIISSEYNVSTEFIKGTNPEGLQDIDYGDCQFMANHRWPEDCEAVVLIKSQVTESVEPAAAEIATAVEPAAPVESAAVESEDELVEGLQALVEAQAIAEQDAFEAEHADEMLIEPGEWVESSDWADDYVLDDDDEDFDAALQEECAALCSDAVCIATAAHEVAKANWGVTGTPADGTCFTAQFVCGIVQDAQVELGSRASVVDVFGHLLERMHAESFQDDFTRADSLVWLYRDHIEHLTGFGGVYENKMAQVQAALADAGLRGYLAAEIENELTSKLAARILAEFDRLGSVANPAMAQEVLEQVNVRVGNLLAFGFISDLGPFLDPDNLRRRFGGRKNAWRKETEAVAQDAPTAQDGAAPTTEHSTKDSEVATAQTTDATAQTTAVTDAPAAPQDSATAPQAADAEAVDYSRYTDDVDTYLHLLTPQRLEPVQSFLEFPEDEGPRAPLAEAGASLSNEVTAADLSGVDYEALEASGGFVYDPESGIEFFGEGDGVLEPPCARAQTTVESDGGGQVGEYPSDFNDAATSVLEACTLTADEVTSLGRKGTGPTSGKAACTAKVTTISAQVEPSAQGGAAVVTSAKTTLPPTDPEGGKGSKVPKAKRGARAGLTGQVLFVSSTGAATELGAEKSAPQTYESQLAHTSYLCAENVHSVFCSESQDWPNLSPTVLEGLTDAGLIPALCSERSSADELRLAWQALSWVSFAGLSPKQDATVQAAYKSAVGILTRIVANFEVWRDSYDELQVRDIYRLGDGYANSFISALRIFDHEVPDFVALRAELMTPWVQNFMTKFYLYQAAAGRTEHLPLSLAWMPELTADIVAGINTEVDVCFGKEFSAVGVNMLKAALQDAHHDNLASGCYRLSPELKMRHVTALAQRLAYMMLWPLTERLTGVHCSSPIDGFTRPNMNLMRHINARGVTIGTGVNHYDALAAACCEAVLTRLHKLSPLEQALDEKSRIRLSRRSVKEVHEIMNGLGAVGASINRGVAGVSCSELKCWAKIPSYAYDLEQRAKFLRDKLDFGGLEAGKAQVCEDVCTQLDVWVDKVKQRPELKWGQHFDALAAEAVALMGDISAQYPNLVAARHEAIKTHLWAVVQQLMLDRVRLEPEQTVTVLGRLLVEKYAYLNRDMGRQLAYITMRRFASDKKYDVKPLKQDTFDLNLNALKACLCFGYFPDSAGYEIMLYVPREVVASYFEPFTFWGVGSLDSVFAQEVELLAAEMLAIRNRLNAGPKGKAPPARRKEVRAGMEG